MCRITYDKQRFAFSTGIYIDPSNWSSKEQKIYAGEPLFESYNTDLLLTKQKIYNTYLKLKFNDEKFTLKDLKNNLQNTNASNEQFILNHYQNHPREGGDLVNKKSYQ